MVKNVSVGRIFWGIISLSLLLFSMTGCTALKNLGNHQSFARSQNRSYLAADAALPIHVFGQTNRWRGTGSISSGPIFSKKGKHTFTVDELRRLIYAHPANQKAYNALGCHMIAWDSSISRSRPIILR